MPVISKPTNDESRLNLLNTSTKTAASDASSGTVLLSEATLSTVTALATDLDTQLKTLAGNLGARSSEVAEKNQAVARLEMFIRDLWEVTKRRVHRNNEPASVLTYYQLPLDGTVPVNINESEIIALTKEIIEGDAKAVTAGFPAATNPSAEELGTADKAYHEAQQALQPIRTKVDEAIVDIIAELEFNLRREEASSRRRVMRRYGVTFTYAKGEPQDEGTSADSNAA